MPATKAKRRGRPRKAAGARTVAKRTAHKGTRRTYAGRRKQNGHIKANGSLMLIDELYQSPQFRNLPKGKRTGIVSDIAAK